MDALAAAISGNTGNGLAIDHVHAYTYDGETGRIDGVIHGNASSVVTEAPFTCHYVANSNLPESTTGPAHKGTNFYEAHRNVLKTKTNADRHTTVKTISAITCGAGTDAANGIGQRESASRSSSTTYNAVSNTEAWKYNAKGEVVDANHSLNAKDRSYAFDGIGNRTSSTDHVGTINYTPNALNQYTAVGSVSPLHDLDGNLIDDGTRLYTWDAENRLVRVEQKSDSAVIAEYRYDYMHRRIYKETTDLAPQGAGASLFAYEEWNLCAEYEASAITGSTDAAITAIKRTYTWGMDLSGSMQGAGGVGGLLAIEEKAGTHAGKCYPLYDGNGNITELVKEGGTTGTTLVADYEYDPFGNTTQSDDSDSSGYHAVNPFKFSTKYHDEETGLYYYGYRYYEPETGRWLNRDPIQERGGINLYGMVGNDLLENWDYLGLINWEDDCVKACRNKLLATKHGKKRIKEIEDLEKEKGEEITVRKRKEGDKHRNAFDSKKLVIYMDCKEFRYWATNYKCGGSITGYWVIASCEEILNHELVHARDRLTAGSQKEYEDKYRKDGAVDDDFKFPNKTEENAVKDTDKLREEIGKPAREKYEAPRFFPGTIPKKGINGE